MLDGTLESYQNLSVPGVHILNWILHIIKRFLSLPSSFVLAVVRHIMEVYETATTHSEDDYFKREAGEISTEVYPNFPILRGRAVYKRDCKIQDKKQRRDSCEKDFPAHSKLTPGLYLLTCGGPQKSV